ncbi:MAG: type IX secretion system membrane protein PorP/SprF [Flavobacteriaceae bacterium]
MLFFLLGSWVMGQSPFLTQPLMMYLGNRYPAALGLLEYAQWHIGVERMQQFSTATYQQHMTWVRPTAGDRWTLGLHITNEERFVVKRQQGSVGWAFRLPLTPRKNIYLGTRIHGNSSMYSFELLQHIERPDPLLDLPNHFWMAFSTSLAYQSKQGYVLLGVNNSPLSRTKPPLSLIIAPSYYLLLGRTFDFDAAVQMKSVIGIEKEVAAPVYFGFFQLHIPWDIQLGLYMNSERKARILWQQPFLPQWEVGFAYGQGRRPFGKKQFGLSLTYRWAPSFSNHIPVKSLEYGLENK